MVGSGVRVISLPINGVVKHIGASHLHSLPRQTCRRLFILTLGSRYYDFTWNRHSWRQLVTFEDNIKLKTSNHQRESLVSSGLSLNIIKLAVSNYGLAIFWKRKSSKGKNLIFVSMSRQTSLTGLPRPHHTVSCTSPSP